MCLSNFVANQKSKFDFVRNLISRLFESFCSIVGCFLVKMSFEGPWSVQSKYIAWLELGIINLIFRT